MAASRVLLVSKPACWDGAGGPERKDPAHAAQRGARLVEVEGECVMMVRLILGVVAGGLLGYGVYRFIGCSSGACPITANPWISTFLGMVLGAMLSGAIG